mgnify:CR=1 FL=1
MRFMCAREKNRLKSNFIHFCPGCLVCRYSESDTVPGKRILEDEKTAKPAKFEKIFAGFGRIGRTGRKMLSEGFIVFGRYSDGSGYGFSVRA